MLPPDQLSVPDKEDLRHRILFVHRKRNDILVLAVTVRNLLPLADPAHAVDQITVLRRLLEPHLLSRLRHFSSQLFDNVIVISIQKLIAFLICSPYSSLEMYPWHGALHWWM